MVAHCPEVKVWMVAQENHDQLEVSSLEMPCGVAEEFWEKLQEEKEEEVLALWMKTAHVTQDPIRCQPCLCEEVKLTGQRRRGKEVRTVTPTREMRVSRVHWRKRRRRKRPRPYISTRHRASTL